MITRFNAPHSGKLWSRLLVVLLLPLLLFDAAAAQGLTCKTFDLQQHAGQSPLPVELLRSAFDIFRRVCGRFLRKASAFQRQNVCFGKGKLLRSIEGAQRQVGQSGRRMLDALDALQCALHAPLKRCQATAFWCGHQASVLCKALGSISQGALEQQLLRPLPSLA